MKAKATFPSHNADFYGYIAPNFVTRAINDVIARKNVEDGAGFSRIYPTIGATWMLGQCVLEYKQLVTTAEEVEIEVLPREQCGVTTLRRAVMRRNGEDVVYFTAKQLPVYYVERKVVPPNVMEEFWNVPAAPCGEDIPFITPIESMELVDKYRVRYCDSDPNHHMTAFRYLDLIMECINYWGTEMRLIERMQVDYRRECMPGDVLKLYHGVQDGLHYVSGYKEDGTVSFHSTVRLSEKVYPSAAEQDDVADRPI